MADEIIVKIKIDTSDVGKAAQETQQKLQTAFDNGGQAAKRLKSETDAATLGIGSMRSAISGLTTVLATLGGIAVFKQITQFGIDLDKSRNAMTALTGSVTAANAKLKELRDLAKASPGVTTNFATQLFQQLKAIGGIGDQTINNVIKSLGKLNTVFGDVGPDFARNLIQIFTQGFERADIKEALGRVPIFEQLLKSAFGTNDPDKLRQLQKAGQLTLGGYLDGLSNAVSNDPRLKNIGETLSGKLQKSFDETKQKLAELGEKLLQVLIPALDKLIPLLSKTLDFLNALPDGLKVATIGIVALAPAINTVTSAIGGLRGAVVALGGFLTTPAGIAALAVLGAGVGIAGFQNLIAKNDAEVQRRLNQFRGQSFDLSGKPVFKTLSDVADFQGSVARGNTKPLTFFNEATGMFSTAQTTGSTLAAAKAAAGTSAAQDAANRALKKQFEDIAEMNKLLSESSNARFDFLLEQMTQLNKDINTQQLQDEKDAAARQRLIIQGRETRQRLTAEADAKAVAQQLTSARRTFGRSGDFISDAFNRGAITPEQAETASQAANLQLAASLREVLAVKEQTVGVDKSVLDDLRDEIDLHQRLGTVISNSERFMRGFNSSIETVGNAFERFGQNVSRAFTNVKDLFNGLKNAVLGFFNDLLGQSLQNLMRQVLAPIVGTVGGLSGIFGQPAAAGAAGGIFRTPGTFPASISASGLQSIANVISGAAGGGISVPASVSQPIPGLPSVGLPIPRAGSSNALINAGAVGAFGPTASSAAQFSLSGFGKSLAAAAPFLGGSIGAGLGGTSTAGNILGAVGGTLGGLAIGAATGAIGGSLGSLFALSGALGPAALIAAPALLIGGVLLGKAKQRAADEESAGQFLTQALNSIEQLAAGIRDDQIDGSQARAIFETQILATFVQQINTLKTESVRKSRLTNQVADLRKVFDARIPELIAAQDARKQAAITQQNDAIAQQQRLQANALIFSKQVPEFAIGGIVPGQDRGFDSVRAFVRPGEMILTRSQQALVMAQSNPNVFNRAGVPGVQGSGRFAGGGIASSVSASDQPIMIENLSVSVLMGKGDATRVVVTGGNTPQGRAVTVKNVKEARTNREL
jgi:hypothetical protein